jgi:hypothetical protein
MPQNKAKENVGIRSSKAREIGKLFEGVAYVGNKPLMVADTAAGEGGGGGGRTGARCNTGSVYGHADAAGVFLPMQPHLTALDAAVRFLGIANEKP